MVNKNDDIVISFKVNKSVISITVVDPAAN